MKFSLRQAAGGLAIGAMLLAAAAPAKAQRWHRRDDTGGRVAAGVAGLAIGAGLAASAAADRDRWYRDNGRDAGYDDTFYRSRGYYPSDGYYADRYRNYDGCKVENRYDSYTGEPIQLRSCN